MPAAVIDDRADRTTYGGLLLDLEIEPGAFGIPLADADPIGAALSPCRHPEWSVTGCIEIGGRKCVELTCTECLAVDYAPSADRTGRGTTHMR